MNRTIHLDTAEQNLMQAYAMVNLTYGEAGETFRNMNDELQDVFLWTLADRITAAKEAIADALDDKPVAHVSRSEKTTLETEVVALREVLHLGLAALEKTLDDGCAIEHHDRIILDGDTWTFAGICARARDVLTSTGEA